MKKKEEGFLFSENKYTFVTDLVTVIVCKCDAVQGNQVQYLSCSCSCNPPCGINKKRSHCHRREDVDSVESQKTYHV